MGFGLHWKQALMLVERKIDLFFAWTPQHWGEKRKKWFYHQLDYFQLEPCYRWRSNNRDLILVPLALQKNHIMRRLKQLGLISLYSQYQRLGHSWTEISPRKWENGDIDDEFEYLGVIESGKNETDKLWSNPHLISTTAWRNCTNERTAE